MKNDYDQRVMKIGQWVKLDNGSQ